MATGIVSSVMTMMSPSPPICCSTQLKERKIAGRISQRQDEGSRVILGRRGGGGWHFVREVVHSDVHFLRNHPSWRWISKGSVVVVQSANEALRRIFPHHQRQQLFRILDDLLWLRNLEEKEDQLGQEQEQDLPPLPPISWPQPHYPELSGLDLFMADVKALEAYASYFRYQSKLWTKPLPELYDPEEVANYFSFRRHVLALRLLEVCLSFVVAAIRIRTMRFRKFSGLDISGNFDEDVRYGFGMVLKETMLMLGPTFIKVGQSLSTRPDIIGSEISKALSELHDQIPPFPRAMAMKMIEEELGSPVEKFFSHISDQPVAAASFGQVYQAQTVDGVKVAIKVQRPYLRHVVVRDIYILRLGLALVQKITKRKSDLRLYADELGKGLVGELDYTIESANALEFKETHAPFSFIRVPHVYQHLSGKRVLTMEWFVGESPSDLMNRSAKGSTDAKRCLLDLVKNGVEASLVQLLDTGLLHADPHPGNLRYISSGEIGFLDFGLLCRMEKKHQLAMLASIVHIVSGDWTSLVLALIYMDVVRPGTNIRRVTMDLEDALGEVELRDGIPDVKFSRVLGQILSIALKYHFRMPPYYTLVLRSLASLEGLAVAADPNFKTFEAAFPYVVQRLLTDNSAATRKILHSVVFNRRKELQWQKLALFLKVGTTRKGLQRLVASDDGTSLKHLENGQLDLAKLVLRFLKSRDGVVMRKLLMTANGASLIGGLISKEAGFVRQSMRLVIADIIYRWLFKLAFGRGTNSPQYASLSRSLLSPELKNQGDISSSSSSGVIINDYGNIFEDRRLKVILLKALDSAGRDNPALVLKFCWASVSILVTASALAFHRMLISLSEAYLGSGSVSFAAREKIAASG